MRHLFLAAAVPFLITSGANAQEPGSTLRIRFVVHGTTVSARLEDNASSRDFLALLPLTVTLEDYAATEKIAYLPRKLSSAGAPATIVPRAGDVAYYAPWGNLAIFHKDFRSSPGLVKLGQIERGLDALREKGSSVITIEREGN